MLKRSLTLILTVAVLCTASVVAQQKQGRWTIYPSVGDDYKNIIETDDRAYMLSAGKLYHYNFDDNEFFEYSAVNKLSDPSSINQIYYNYDKGYLLVTYTSGNMDIIEDSGKVTNLPEIKDAILNTGHNINHVDFGKDRIYIATDFGIVVYDDIRKEVIESGIYEVKTDFIFSLGDYLLLLRGTDAYVAPAEGRHTLFDVFTSISKIWHQGEIHKLGGSKIVFKATTSGKNIYYICDVDAPNATYKNTNSWVLPVHQGMQLKDGIFAQEADSYAFINKEGKVTRTTIPDALKGKRAYTTTSTASMWVNDRDGIAHYDVSGTTPTQLMSPYRPAGFTVLDPCIMQYSNDGNRLYIANKGPSNNWANPGDNYGTPVYMDIVENGEIRDAAVHNASQWADKYIDWITDDETDRLCSGNKFIEDPDDPSIYYLADNNSGLIVVQDGKVLYAFNNTNAPVTIDWRQRTMDVNIDRHGNLWMGHGYTPGCAYSVLPADKRRAIASFSKLSPSTVKTYWKEHKPLYGKDFFLERDVVSLFCKKSRYGVFLPGKYGFGIAAYDDNDTPMSFTDDHTVHHTTFTDTEGNSLTYPFLNCVVEDHNGRLWVGTNRGLFVIENPADMFEPSFRVKRPIVARNDGTEYGDYLLDSHAIQTIAVDPSNRKWITTSTSGVYLVSADGTEILANYTTNNSVLPSDQVWTAACDPHSNIVYFGTSNGIVSYESDSAPAADDYSEVYAYPNPVRPEYTGWITITGLMDKSLVKIADAAGNVFYQGRSEGGIVTWDGCAPDGSRVRSGVYFVYASQNASGSASGVVTKIMVVN